MEIYKEVFTNFIYTILTAILPLLTGYIILYLRQKIGVAQAEQIIKEAEKLGIDADVLNKYIDMAENAVYKAVMETNQTYVDSLKKEHIFDLEAQNEALSKSLEKAKTILSAEAKDILESAFGDINVYLTTSIEALIRSTKTE